MKQLIEIGVIGGLLAASLVGTYLAYHSDDKPDDGKGTAVYVAAVTDLQVVAYESEKKSVRIERKSDERGEYLWLTVTERTEVTRAIEPAEVDTDVSIDDTDDTDAPQAPDFETITEEKTQSFLGNKQAESLWESFAPFKAARELDAGTSTAEFGFDEPYGTISVTRKSGEIKMTLGAPTYGNRSRYLQLDQRTFLVEKKALNRIESAGTSLPERRLHPLKYEAIRTISATWEGQTRTWTHQNPDDKRRSYWAPEGKPDTNAKAASGWLAKASRAAAKAYVSPAPEGLTAVLTLKLSDGTDTWNIEVNSDGADPPVYYASTSYNRSLVEITSSQAEDLVVDAKAAFEDEGSPAEGDSPVDQAPPGKPPEGFGPPPDAGH